jgi:hypothetical protein
MAIRTGSSNIQTKHDYADILIAIITGLMLVHVTLYLCIMPFVRTLAAGNDFVVYWATGQQLAHHSNPYDWNAMMRIEHSAGLAAGRQGGLMRNPPWGLILAWPLGFAGLQVGAVLWSLAQLTSLMVSIHTLWRMHGSPRTSLIWLGVAFAPALLCLITGQTSVFLLLGFVQFLRLHRSHPFRAGASLWLCTLKPHLFLPIGIVLLAWILVSKKYRLLAGATVAMAASCLAVAFIDPAAWAEYARMMRNAGIESEHILCLSVALRLWLSPQRLWLNYLPTAVGCTWALGYFWPRRHTWDWMRNGSPLMLTSLVTAPYAWISDGSLAIPALLQGAYLTRSRMLLVVLASASVLIEIELFCGFKLDSPLYLWTAPAWLGWYLLATRIKRTEAKQNRITTLKIAETPHRAMGSL